MIINATHIGKKLDGIGRFSLLLAKHFLKKENYKVLINKDAIQHFTNEEINRLIIKTNLVSPCKNFPGHLFRLINTNFIKGNIFNLSQLEVSFWNKKQIIVIHDLIPLLFKREHKKQYFYFKYILPKILKNKTKLIITVSNHTKKLIVDTYSIDENKIKVIYNGINIPKEKSVKKDNYIFFVGRNSPTKNIDGLIKSFIKLKEDNRFKNLKLYIAGFKKNFYRNDIVSLGYVSDKQLDELYRKAKIFFLPSFYEGFGYTVLEAMIRKTAVVTSNIASLPEITGGNAIYVDPHNISDMVLKLKSILLNDQYRKELEIKGFEHAKKFDIKIMLKNYEKVLNESCNS